MRKKFEVIQGGGNATSERKWKFPPGEATYIVANCTIIRETAKAWCIQPPGWELSLGAWIPKRCTILHTHASNKQLHDVEIPEKLAKDKGLYT